MRRPEQRGLLGVASPSAAAPMRPIFNGPSRRDIVLSGLIGTVMSLASHAVAAPQAGDIPTFESGRHQFTVLRPQREVPSIKLFRLEGGVIDLSSLRGKPVLLNFWASWCAACRTELPILERQYRSAWRRNLHVAAVSEDRGSRDTVERFIKTLELRTLPEKRAVRPLRDADHLSHRKLRIDRWIHAGRRGLVLGCCKQCH